MQITEQYRLVEDFRRLELEVVPPGTVAQLFTLVVQHTLLDRIMEGQQADAIFVARWASRSSMTVDGFHVTKTFVHAQ